MCISPITLKQPDGSYTQVPCGKCTECVTAYQNMWSFRLEREYSNWKYAYYLTLTYRDECIPYVELQVPERTYVDDDGNEITEQLPYLLDVLRNRIFKLPPNKNLNFHRHNLRTYNAYLNADNIEVGIPVPTVSKADVQNWFKRCRERYFRSHGERLDFKYFVSSEYGPNTFRPHYHAIIFTNLSVSEFSDLFVTDWNDNYGRVDWQHRPIYYDLQKGVQDVMSYVAKYCAKPAEVESPYVVLGFLPKPFRLISKKIGYSYLKHLARKVADWQGVRALAGYKYKYTYSYCKFLYLRAFRVWLGERYVRVPRYYVDKIFPHKRYLSYYVNSQNQVVPRYQWRKDPYSDLSVTYKTFVQSYNSDRIRSDLQTLASAMFGRVDLETLNKAETVYSENRLQSYKEKTERLYSHYARGKRCERL